MASVDGEAKRNECLRAPRRGDMLVDGWMEPSHSRQKAILHVYSYWYGQSKICRREETMALTYSKGRKPVACKIKRFKCHLSLFYYRLCVVCYRSLYVVKAPILSLAVVCCVCIEMETVARPAIAFVLVNRVYLFANFTHFLIFEFIRMVCVER